MSRQKHYVDSGSNVGETITTRHIDSLISVAVKENGRVLRCVQSYLKKAELKESEELILKWAELNLQLLQEASIKDSDRDAYVYQILNVLSEYGETSPEAKEAVKSLVSKNADLFSHYLNEQVVSHLQSGNESLSEKMKSVEQIGIFYESLHLSIDLSGLQNYCIQLIESLEKET